MSRHAQPKNMHNKIEINKRILITLLASALILCSTAAWAQTTVLIDDFTTDQAALSLTSPGDDGTSSASSIAGGGILGSERDLIISLTTAGIGGNGVSAFIGSASLSYSQDPTVDASGQLQWDGADGSAALDPTGLGGIDLTNGGIQDAIQLEVVFDDTPISLDLEFFTDGTNSSVVSLPLPGLIFIPNNYIIPFSALSTNLGAGVDLTNVGAIRLSFASLTAPDLVMNQIRTASLVAATKVDALLLDGNMDGMANPGDTLRYTVLIENPDDAFDATATGVAFASAVDANTSLVVGSVTTTQGTITTGNTAGDTSVALDLGDIADAGSITVTYDVTINSPLAIGLTAVSCQGLVTSDTLPGGLPTDDPDDPTSPDMDPTLTPVFGSPMIESDKADSILIDANMDGVLNPGDTLRYTVSIDNNGDGDATMVLYSSAVDANTTLVVGSVTTTQGSVTSGNTAGDSSIAIDLGTLAAAGSASLTFDVILMNPLPLGVNEITCQGMVAGSNFTTEPTNDPDTGPDDDSTLTPVAANPIIEATKADSLLIDNNMDAGVGAGDTVKYTVVVTNTGDQDASMVTYSSPVDPNTSLSIGTVTTTQGSVTAGNGAGDTSVGVDIGTLAVGDSITICFEVVLATPFPDVPMEIACQGLVAGGNFVDEPTDDPATGADDDPTLTPVVRPDLLANKSYAITIDANMDGIANPGDVVKYTVIITNGGAGGADTVTFDTGVDANSTLNVGSVTTTQGTVTTGNGAGDSTVAIAVGDILPTASVTLCFEVTVNDPLPAGVTQLTCQGSVSASNGPTLPTDDPSLPGDSDPTLTPAGGAATIEADKADTLVIDVDMDNLVDAGDSVKYTVTLTNTSSIDGLDVLYTSAVDPNSMLIVGSVSTTLGVVTSGNGAGDSGIGIDIGTLPANTSVTVCYTVQVVIPLSMGIDSITCQGMVSGSNVPTEPTNDPDTTPDDDPTVTPLDRDPLISTRKTSSLASDLDGNGNLSAGDSLEYTIVITNDGNEDAMAVLFDDTPDPNTTLEAGTVVTSQGTVLLGNTAGDTMISVDVGTIAAAGGMVSITFQVAVHDPLPPGTIHLVNQGITSGSNFPPNLSDDPNEPGLMDPTADPIGGGILEIPTLNEWGLLLLILSLAGLGLRRLGTA